MNAVDAATFKNLTELLVRYSSASPFMIVALNIPLLGAIPYYYFCGFGNWRLTAGLTLWLTGGTLAKIYKLPVYKSISTLNSGDTTIPFNQLRQKLDKGNIFQAVVYSVAVVVMALGFVRF